MPRYYFSTANGDVHVDRDGTDLSNLAEARAEAARVIGQILRDHPDRFWDGGDLTLMVSNAEGLALFQIVVMAIKGPLAR